MWAIYPRGNVAHPRPDPMARLRCRHVIAIHPRGNVAREVLDCADGEAPGVRVGLLVLVRHLEGEEEEWNAVLPRLGRHG